ncbi:unnamed protein product [Mucor circinelloides]
MKPKIFFFNVYENNVVSFRIRSRFAGKGIQFDISNEFLIGWLLKNLVNSDKTVVITLGGEISYETYKPDDSSKLVEYFVVKVDKILDKDENDVPSTGGRRDSSLHRYNAMLYIYHHFFDKNIVNTSLTADKFTTNFNNFMRQNMINPYTLTPPQQEATILLNLEE